MKNPLLPLRLISALTAVLLVAGLPAQAARHKRTVAPKTLTFQVATDAKITVGANHAVSLSALKLGERVVVAYDQEHGSLVAHRISEEIAPKTTAHRRTGKQVAHHKVTSSLLHAQGVLEAINSQAGTVTIAAKRRA